MTIMAVLLWSL